MKYLWINPVTERMYEKQVLNEFIMQHGYKRVEVSKDWLLVVREKYKKVVQNSEKTVIDVRCPMAAELVKKIAGSDNLEFPKIHPILIHCGCELAEMRMKEREELIITTPCQALADLGNGLHLKNTIFVTWNQFLRFLNSEPEGRIQMETPIPLGFFDELNFSRVSLSGKEQICDYFQKDFSKEVQLVELLYCENGCHNGDGIIEK